MKQPKPRTVELVRSAYQPTKAEMEEKWELPEGLTLARIIQCAVERRVFLVGANPTQQLSLSVGSSRGGTWR